MQGLSLQRGVQRGLTLIELMITLVVLAVALSITAPSFYDTIKNNRLRTQVDRVVTSLNLARSEAVKRNIDVFLCPSSDGASCTGNFADGWLLFADVDPDGSLDASSDDVVIRVFDALPNGYTITGTDGASAYGASIIYHPDGSSSDPAPPPLYICPPDKDAESAWAIFINIVGRPRASVGSDGGGFSCPG